MTPMDCPRSAPGTSGSTQPSFHAVSVMNFSTEPMVTAPWPENSMTQLPSHRRSCGQMRPQISGMVEVALDRSEEHTSELQSLMRISYAVFCLKKKNNIQTISFTHKIIHLLTSTQK